MLEKMELYKLFIYYLLSLFTVAIILSFFKILPFNPFNLMISIFVTITFCFLTNTIFAKAFNASSKTDSIIITAIILALIISPPQSANYIDGILFLIWASVWAMASKYIFAVKKRHIFNPAAFSVALLAFTINQSANWWIGNLYMLPFVLFGGIIITLKTKRIDMIGIFISVVITGIFVSNFLNGANQFASIYRILLYTSLLFFSFVMLTDPMTGPTSKKMKLIYAAFIGFLFIPSINIAGFYLTPELSILIGNVIFFGVKIFMDPLKTYSTIKLK